MYLKGFGNHHESEAIPGALPSQQNSPQQCPFGLFAEQLSGSAFTRSRHANLRSWLYRTLPSVVQGEYIPYSHPQQRAPMPIQAPNPLRWSPYAKPKTPCDFVDSLIPIANTPLLQTYLYQCQHSMTNRYMSNLDGELLFIPYQGELCLRTEFGVLRIAPGMIAVLPRGVVCKIELIDTYAAGYLCENAGTPLTLPPLGIIGANGLANPRHFFYPKAAMEEAAGDVTLLCQSQHHWWQAKSAHSPLNVAAWHGNYAPYGYDLSLFNPLGSISFDHPDPSLFTVLTSESDTPGVANLDFVIFPPRWMVSQHTFRPPYYHRNVMNEWMGLVTGTYDAKQDGFAIGGFSIHNRMVPHGPDTTTYQKAIAQTLEPQYYDHTLAFMLESRDLWQIDETAFHHPARQNDYSDCWQGLAGGYGK